MKARNPTPIMPCTASTRARNVGGRLPPNSDTAAPNTARMRTQSSIEPSWFRSEEHTSELQSLMRISYAVFCLKKKKKQKRDIKQQSISRNKKELTRSTKIDRK